MERFHRVDKNTELFVFRLIPFHFPIAKLHNRIHSGDMVRVNFKCMSYLEVSNKRPYNIDGNPV